MHYRRNMYFGIMFNKVFKEYNLNKQVLFKKADLFQIFIALHRNVILLHYID